MYEERRNIKNFLKNVGITTNKEGLFTYLDKKDYAIFLDLTQLIYEYYTKIYEPECESMIIENKTLALKFLLKIIKESYLYRNPQAVDTDFKKKGMEIDFLEYENLFYYLNREDKEIKEIEDYFNDILDKIKMLKEDEKTLNFYRRENGVINENGCFLELPYEFDYLDRDENGYADDLDREKADNADNNNNNNDDDDGKNECYVRYSSGDIGDIDDINLDEDE